MLDLLIVLSTFFCLLESIQTFYGASTLLLNFCLTESNRTKISLPNNWIGKVIHSHFLHLDSRLFITFVGGQPVSPNVSEHCLNPSKKTLSFFLFRCFKHYEDSVKACLKKEMF